MSTSYRSDKAFRPCNLSLGYRYVPPFNVNLSFKKDINNFNIFEKNISHLHKPTAVSNSQIFVILHYWDASCYMLLQLSL